MLASNFQYNSKIILEFTEFEHLLQHQLRLVDTFERESVNYQYDIKITESKFIMFILTLYIAK